MAEASILRLENVSKVYRRHDDTLTVVSRITFELKQGTTCAILGPSGSGKTTLLGLCAGLDRPSAGSIWLDGILLNELDQEELARLRNQKIGFVFQNFQLIPTLTAIENVMVPLELRGGRPAATQKRAQELLKKVGLYDRRSHYPAQLSGGEQQRVALARAFINEPKILFADEPTGNLDHETSHLIVELIFQLNQEHGTTLILVTHDQELAARAQRKLFLRAGSLGDIQIP